AADAAGKWTWDTEIINARSGRAGQVCRSDRRVRGLIDVVEAEEPVTLRSYITHLQSGLVGDLLLDVDVVVLHVGSLDVAIHGKNVTLEVTCGFVSENRGVWGDRAARISQAR